MSILISSNGAPALPPLGAACAAIVDRRFRQLLQATPDVTRLALMIGATPADVVAALAEEYDAYLVDEEAFDLLPAPVTSALRQRSVNLLARAVQTAALNAPRPSLAAAG